METEIVYSHPLQRFKGRLVLDAFQNALAINFSPLMSIKIGVCLQWHMTDKNGRGLHFFQC